MYKPPKSVTVRPLAPGDVEFVAANMRQEDVDEVWASSFNTPIRALTCAVRDAEKVWALDYDGQPVAIFGVSRRGYLSNVGAPWLLGTNEIRKHTAAFLRLSRVYVPIMAEGFVRLENFVDFRNKLSIRWLRWIGFDIGELVPGLVLGVKFHKFSMETNQKCATP